MALNLVSLKCPECGASLEVEEGRESCFCSYCGAKVVVNNDNEFVYRHIDEAGVKKAETDRIVRLRELDMQEKSNSHLNTTRKILTIIWIVISLIVLALTIYQWAFVDSNDGFLMLFYLCGPIVAGGAYLIFKVIPDKENEKQMLNRGGVRFPSGVFETNYEFARNTLLNLGFTNVDCINMHDIKIGLLTKPGQVESIKVDGEVAKPKKIYSPEANITIIYHGK